jgi:hypothetical protein
MVDRTILIDFGEESPAVAKNQALVDSDILRLRTKA